ncbi:MAG TPA: methyltransferase domain-containing protein [Methylomirabilota bacterium]|nr:methyltransferase domain-containing protein [Methylomirabilota bacterium]
MAIDQAKLNALLGRAVVDIGANFHAALVVTGDKLGLFRALRDHGPTTSGDLAKRTNTHERYVREWLSAMAAGGYVGYESASEEFSLSEEQALALIDADLPGAFLLAQATVKSEPRITEAFRSGKGVGWHEHDPGLFEGTERFFRPGYAVNLVPTWIPALEGVQAKLEKGGQVADVGCGHGSSTILMAKAFPASRFVGFDYHDRSIDWARETAKREGLGDRVSFEVASSKDYPGTGYDLVAFFDSLHDMGDPVGIGRHVRRSLGTDGTWLLVEPFAHDRLEENLNPVGRMYYAASTMLCTPNSLAQEVGAALGAQAGEGRLKRVATEAGFTRFRRAAETPFNLVFEARP